MSHSASTRRPRTAAPKRTTCPHCRVIPAPGHGCHWQPEAVAIREAILRPATKTEPTNV
jgi:hypothetical protein